MRWLHGDATTLPPLQVDLATMTANVAQVFRTDDAWTATLRGIRSALAPGGWLVLETRDPARRAWEGWVRDATVVRADVPDVGPVESWTDLTDVSLPIVSSHDTTVLPDGTALHSDSTLRFRERDEVEATLAACGFEVVDVRDAPDRPGREWVCVACRA
ncbi:class I SAM-dependent methyltransferase [Cellulosimicrobium cellulans]|uniref:class I SAM-dependent methyltransferase n=1 Tax=Cellulosimicrobium cellulans TaxID=1710 RepID=UPI001EDB4E76|nr:class I SAM-dependent methyltransferase [Cellulosimicrobium cellulans]